MIFSDRVSGKGSGTGHALLNALLLSAHYHSCTFSLTTICPLLDWHPSCLSVWETGPRDITTLASELKARTSDAGEAGVPRSAGAPLRGKEHPRSGSTGSVAFSGATVACPRPAHGARRVSQHDIRRVGHNPSNDHLIGPYSNTTTVPKNSRNRAASASMPFWVSFVGGSNISTVMVVWVSFVL
jgi:hypothetical protein